LIINNLRNAPKVLLHILGECACRESTFIERMVHGIRYRVNGKQVSAKLADYTDEYRTLTSVRPLA